MGYIFWEEEFSEKKDWQKCKSKKQNSWLWWKMVQRSQNKTVKILDDERRAFL